MSSLSHRASQFAGHAAESGVDAAVTIAARAARAATLHGGNARENVRMVEEKVSAVCEGAMAAGFAWASFMMQSAMRGGATPAQLSHAWFDAAEAAARPAWRTVGANARRLTR